MTCTAIYARFSSEHQREESIDDQVRVCRDLAKSLNLRISDDHIFCDRAISGSRRNRPDYQRMLKAAEAKEYEALIVFKQDRLGRDSVEVEQTIRRIEFYGIRLAMCDGYDTLKMPQKQRKLMRGFKGLMDEAYLDDLRENTHRGLMGQALKTFWCGGKPYGYRLIEVKDSNRRDA